MIKSSPSLTKLWFWNRTNGSVVLESSQTDNVSLMLCVVLYNGGKLFAENLNSSGVRLSASYKGDKLSKT